MSVSVTTQKELWSFAGNQCAFTGCQQELVDPELSENGESLLGVLGEVAHIRSHRPDGPRFDGDFPKDQLHRAGNLILLCPTHHQMVDGKKGTNYSVDDLLQIKRRHQAHHAVRSGLSSGINAYIGGCYADEDELNFHQAGLRVPSVEATFVDVVAGVSLASPLGSLFQKIQKESPGDPETLNDRYGDVAVGGAQALLHPDWEGNAIIVGGPGQGKSTLLQYICQFHRAKHLGKSDYQASDKGLARYNTIARIPIRVDLKKYAQWAAHREGMSAKPEVQDAGEKPRRLPSIEEYLLEEIGKNTGIHEFSRDDFVAMLATEPVLLALDGLDEVANIHLREGVLGQIRSLHGRLRTEAADLSIVVATRPGSSLETLTGTGDFPLLRLKKLSHGLRTQYLDRWIQVASLGSEAASRLRSIFGRNANLPHIQELASYPMQLAILLNLLNTKQLLPQKRADLYKQYLETFLDREESEDKEPLLYEHRQVLLATHAYIGWYLHCRAEESANAGTISRDELRQQVLEHLADHEQDRQLAEHIFQSISTRWLCLIERDEGMYEFEVQSLQEYFAAVYMFDNLTPKGENNSRDDGLMAMLERPHWTNVCRFFIGHYGKSEIRALKDNLEEVEERGRPYPPIRSMGLLALNDRNFDHLSDTVKKRMVEFVLRDDGVFYSEDGLLEGANDRVELGKAAGRVQALEYLLDRAVGGSDIDLGRYLAQVIRRHADETYDVTSWWLENFRTELSWLEVGVRLGALRGLTASVEDDIANRAFAVEFPEQWLTPLLVQGGCHGSEVMLKNVKNEFNDGAVNLVDPSRGTSALASLTRDAWVATLHAVSLGTPPADDREPIEKTESDNIGLLQSARMCSLQIRDVDFSSTKLADWERWLGAIHDEWGNGWILRLAASVVPPSADLSSLVLRIRGSRPVLAEILSEEEGYRSNTRDCDWWMERLAACADGLDKRWWIVKLCTLAKYQVVEALAESTNKVVSDLAGKYYASVESTLRIIVARSGARPPLDLRSALRADASKWHGSALWLLRVVSTDSSQTEINRALRKDLNSTLRCGALDAGEIVSAVDTGTKKLDVDDLYRTRRALSTARWDVTRIKIPNSKKAKEILSQPAHWPRQLVLEAGDVHARTLARRLPPMSRLAAKNEWFVE